LTTDLEPATPSPEPHPVRMRYDGDLPRQRLKVFFRLIITIPHLFWLAIWTIGAILLSIVNWVATLVRGQTPDGLHRFFCAYLNYSVHVYSFLYLAAERYPGFTGEPGYEVDVSFDPPERQNRWTVAFRIILAIPVFVLVGILTGSGNYSTYTSYNDSGSTTDWGVRAAGVAITAAVLAWFYSLVRARAPEGIVRAILFCLHFGAQAGSYIFVITDRYPNPDPAVLGVPRRPVPHPIALRVPQDELERSRLTVFFRLLLAIPHLIWLALWAIGAFVVVILNWFATVFSGRSPDGFHSFLAAFVRYATHVYAYIALIANPFPGFTGTPGSYPVDVEIAGPEPQNRWITGFRIFLAIPAAVLSSALGAAIYAAAFFGWWVSLFTGRMPRGLRNLGAYALRYSAQVDAYALLLTDRYPYAGPPADAESVPTP
jgi:hypothetical protein